MAAIATLVAASCGGSGSSGIETSRILRAFQFRDTIDVADGKPMSPHVGCDGEGVSPGLAWRAVPKGTVELALVLEDPDAPSGTFTHWLVWGIAPAARRLDDIDGLPQGRNDFGNIGYGAPCPPPGQTHHYLFRLLALDRKLDLARDADRASFDAAVQGHVLFEALTTTTYRRG
jgi:Raf kinase inhibitor-like YbhB/YbcL family protein